jgi:magnesium transporter
MNFEFMPELNWVYGYPLILAIIFVVCALMYGGFKRARWL